MAGPFAPYFTTNDGDIAQLEGLYVKERNPPASVRGVNLNTIGVGGVCARGVIGKTVLITSEARFVQVYGADKKPSGTTTESEVWKAILNKRFGNMYVVRATAAAAVAASYTLETAAGGAGTALLRIDANGPGLWGNDIGWSVTAATDANANHFNLNIRYNGNILTYQNLNIFTSVDDNTLATIGDDDGNLITLTKLASGRPYNSTGGVDGADTAGYTQLGQTVAGFTSVAGTDGSIADSDFTASGKVIDLLANQKGVAAVFMAGRSTSAVKSSILTKAAAASDRMFLVCPDTDQISAATAITEAATLASDRIVYCFNHPYTLNPQTGTNMMVEPHAWMASIFSQTNVNDHVGNNDTKAFLAGIVRLTNAAYDRGQYIAFKAAGICALAQDVDGFEFVSGVTTSLTPGRTEIARRRSADFIQLSLAAALAPQVKKPNTLTRRKLMKAMIDSFLQGYKDSETIVSTYTTDGEILNTQATRDAGVERILVRVKLISHVLELVLETEIGTAVNITEVK